MIYAVQKQPLKNGEIMAYREENTKSNAPVLLLIHGNQSSSLYYEHFMQDLKTEAHIYAIDMMGFGESSCNHQHTTMKDWADDVALFMEEKHISSAIVLGWSAGGGTALELAACYPEKVSHLILMASVGVKGFRLAARDEKGNILEGQFLSKREDIIKDPQTMIPITNAIESKDVKFLHWVWEKTIFNLNPPIDSDFDAYMNEIIKERCFVDISVALCQFNITDEKALVEGSGRINNITCPVTWIHGKKDIIVAYAVGEDSIRYFKNGNLYPIEDAGHASFIDQPNIFNKKLIEIIHNTK